MLHNLINNSIVYYINLDERKDRNEHILNELKQLFPEEIINRFPAVKHINGAIGCTQSHINILFKFIKSDKDICFIFEDDFKFLFPIDDVKMMLSSALKDDFNVIMMSYNGLGIEFDYMTIYDNLAHSMKNARTTAGYIIHKKFGQILLNNFLSGLTNLIDTEDKTKYAIDMYWHSLQNHENKFYAMMPCIGTQISGYSTIEHKNIDYVQCNTCILLTDFEINDKKNPFYYLKYNYINENTIKNIKKKYPNINYLFRITNDLIQKINWNIIYDIYKNIVHKNMLKQFKNPYFKLSIDNNNLNIVECVSLNYNDTFFVILN
jgi:GR25 family glycosyltransferase involved in LPS biosynthesis